MVSKSYRCLATLSDDSEPAFVYPPIQCLLTSSTLSPFHKFQSTQCCSSRKFEQSRSTRSDSTAFNYSKESAAKQSYSLLTNVLYQLGSASWRKNGARRQVVLIWYREQFDNLKALKEAKQQFPLSKIYVIRVKSTATKFEVQQPLPKEFLLYPTINVSASGPPFIEIPRIAHLLNAKHIFAVTNVNVLDTDMFKVRERCEKMGITFHVSCLFETEFHIVDTSALILGTSFLSHVADVAADTTSMTLWESHVNGSQIRYFVKDGVIAEGTYTNDKPIFDRFIDWLTRLYLPDGYPNSVTRDYLGYSFWRAVQNLAASVMGVFATEALLFGLGLGRKSTAATSAAISWVLKDGLGYIGKVIYGSIAGNQFDVDPKSWRIVADAVEDAGGVLEIITPLFPGQFLLLASIANAMKGVAAMTGTATRHSIYKSLALRENQGDIATKGESQGVTCKMIGLGLGILVSSKLGQKYFALLSAYALGCFIHLFANWKSMSCVQFATLNRQRCSLALQEYFEKGQVPSPYEISCREKIVFPPWKGYRESIVIGATIKEAFRSGQELRDVLKLYKDSRYLLKKQGDKVFVVLRDNCRSEDIFQAFMQAHKVLSGSSLSDSLHYSMNRIKGFLRACSQQGWNTKYPLMGAKAYRVRW
eukprot:jgi/Galph1/322/GphlegSOOS_G5121.1